MMKPPIIFLHLQKTGGISLRQVMMDVYGDDAFHVGNRNRAGEWGPLTEEQQNGLAWYGHMSFGLHQLLPGIVPYFTVMRDPLAREVSRFCNNHQRYAGQSLVNSYRPYWGMTFLLSGVPRTEEESLTETHVDMALENLNKHFLFVGDTSRMAEVGLWLRDRLGWNIELPLPHLNKANPTVLVPDGAVDELRDHPAVQLDQKLYQRVQELGPYPQDW